MKSALKATRKVTVYHVGFLLRGPLTPYDAGLRSPRAYEGPGLSVSTVPRAWTRIAKLGGRPTWALTRRDGRPGLFAIWNQILQARANTFGMKAGLLQKVKVYEVTSQSDDDTEYVSRYNTMAEALEDSSGEIDDIVEASEYVPPGGKVEDATWAQADVLGRYIAQRPGDFDGVWWDETYDPYGLSAPRGVILPYAITRWQAAPSDYVEDEWEGA